MFFLNFKCDFFTIFLISNALLNGFDIKISPYTKHTQFHSTITISMMSFTNYSWSLGIWVACPEGRKGYNMAAIHV